jgi:hypothetical protein
MNVLLKLQENIHMINMVQEEVKLSLYKIPSMEEQLPPYPQQVRMYSTNGFSHLLESLNIVLLQILMH